MLGDRGKDRVALLGLICAEQLFELRAVGHRQREQPRLAAR